MSVAKPLNSTQASLDIRIYILKRSHTNVMCVIRPLSNAHTFGVIRECIPERSHTSVLNVARALDNGQTFSSVQFSRSVMSDAVRPMNCSTPRLPVHHQLQEFTQTHVHRVGNAIQPSHPLSSPSPPAPNPSQQQSLFQ